MPDSRAKPAPALSLHEESPCRWRIDQRGAMRVPGIVFASRGLLPTVRGDRSLEQVENVATLPDGGVVSPGGDGLAQALTRGPSSPCFRRCCTCSTHVARCR